MKVLGLDACRGKWLAVAVDEGQFEDARLASDAATLVSAWPEVAAIGVDIPIGIPETP
jgi:predicted RNase H-like nuclease